MWISIFVLLAISAYYAWRYSKTSVDPDWALFNMWGFCGSAYGRDFADCKTPAIHIWYLLLAKLMGKSIPHVKFAHHFLIGSVGVILFLVTGNVWGALVYTIMINSGWLFAFHGNVGQLPAALLALGIATHSPILWLAAVFCEPKLLPAFVVAYWKLAIILLPFGVLYYFLFRNQQWFMWLWESSFTIPARMGMRRKGLYHWMPWSTANGALYLMPWVGLAVYNSPDFYYWLPVLAFILFLALGRAVWQNHYLPVVAFVALSGLPPVFCLLVAISDLVSAGFYLGNIWLRFYGVLDRMNVEARLVGEYLANRPGTVYMNGIHSAVYLYAKRPALFGLVEQIEVRESAHERRKKMVAAWKKAPPDWVIQGEMPAVKFEPHGYKMVEKIGSNLIYQKAQP